MSRVAVCTGLLAAAIASATPADGPAPVTPPEHRRGAEQTYLTFPEWFLVHSPAEYASYLARERCGRAPSAFPYFGHVGQFWDSYAAVSGAAAEAGDVNLGYHVMVLVIGSSTTVEYALKAAYESTVGRFAEAARDQPVAEDCVAAQVAQDYVDFIRVQPWYEYDFVKALRRVWAQPAADNAAWGDALRRWERRWFLSTEYAVKAAYGWLIKKATKAAYEEPLLMTAIVTDGGALHMVPRYEAFMPAAQVLAAQGLNFREIAGNRGRILVSVWLRDGANAPGLSGTLFEQPILTEPGMRRVVAAVPVDQLAELLRRWQGAGVKLEHVYDY
jgi:hypothetical protein